MFPSHDPLGSGLINSAQANNEIQGYKKDNGTVLDTLNEFRQVFDYDFYSLGSQYVIKEPSTTPVFTINRDDLGAGENTAEEKRVVRTNLNESTLPQLIELEYADFTFDYETAIAYASIPEDATDSRIKGSLATSVALTPSEAQTLVTRVLSRTWRERTEFKFTLPVHKARNLTPGDHGILPDGDDNILIKIKEIKGAFKLEFIAVPGDYDSITVLSGGQGRAGTPSSDQGFTYQRAESGAVLLDSSAVNCDDAIEQYEIGSYPQGAGNWVGADLFSSTDGTNFTAEGSVATKHIAAATNALGDVVNPLLLDNGNSITVYTAYRPESASFVDITLQPLLNLIRVQSGSDWEWIKFTTVVINEDTNQVVLSGLLRGLRGTEHLTAGHKLGDLVVFEVVDATIKGTDNFQEDDTVYLAARTSGVENLLPSVDYIGTYTARRIQPYAPFNLEAENVSGDVEVTAIRLRS